MVVARGRAWGRWGEGKLLPGAYRVSVWEEEVLQIRRGFGYVLTRTF